MRKPEIASLFSSFDVVWAGFGVTALGQPASLMTAAAAATPRANHDAGYVTVTSV